MAFFKTIWKANSKHKKLMEELTQQNKELEIDTNEPLNNENDVITFKLKYLGSTIIEKISSDGGKEAVKNILKTAKASKGKKKLQRIQLNISLQGITVIDAQCNDLFKISIYRISNCCTDSTHPQIFSFISTDQNEIMECHAFLCSKRKIAESVTLAVAQAFNAVYESWKIVPTSGKFDQNLTVFRQNIKNEPEIQNVGKNIRVEEEKLIDFDSEDDDSFNFQSVSHNDNAKWVCFEEDFSPSMTQSRSKHPYEIDAILA